MWGGRFASGPDAIMEEINASIGFDYKLALQDIEGSKAHAAMLADAGIMTAEDAAAIANGLAAIQKRNRERRRSFSRARSKTFT